MDALPQLTPVEARVLGALIEKDVTTPDYYPLSLNALVNACNQKNNREPVMDLSEEQVREALDGLSRTGFAGPARGADSRVTKYEHRMPEVFNFTRGEEALICVLLLRGPQTVGELRGRTERLYRFEDISAVQSTLNRLSEHEPPFVVMLARQPGTKEPRFAHLFSGVPEQASAGATQHSVDSAPGSDDRVGAVERELATVREELAELKRQFAEFRKAFE